MDYYIEVLNYITTGLGVTIKLFVVTLVLSIPLGMLLATASNSSIKPISASVALFTWILRGTPLLLQLYFTMYALPIFTPFRFSRMMVAYITFTINYSAYFTEIFRGGINSIDNGQYQAAKALGLSKAKTFILVILPQAAKKVLPSVANEAITLIKDTALVSTIALADVLRNAKELVSKDIRVEALFVAGAIYLALTFVLVVFFRKLEAKYSYFR